MSPSTRHSGRRRLADYLQAVQNDIAIDEVAFALAGTDPRSVGYLPRPGKWLGRVPASPLVTRCLSWISIVLWQCGASVAFHFLQMARAYRAVTREQGRSSVARRADDFALILSSRAADVISPDSVDVVPGCWITMPWVSVKAWPPDVERVNVLALLSSRDLWLAFKDSTAATRIMSRRRRSAAWALQTYTAFNWFAVRRALERLDGNFTMAEHFDRWAVLVDGVAAQLRARRLAEGRHAPELVLVQHGAMGRGLSAEGAHGVSRLAIKRRLRAVTALCVYDEQSGKAFTEDVLSPRCVGRGVAVRYFRPKISLQSTPQRGRVRVLFVGHPFCDELQTHILAALKNDHDVDAFYKPHPCARMDARLMEHDWTVVDDCFPEVDLLVSYPSTLVIEYQALNIPAVVHSMDLARATADEFIESVRQAVERLSAPQPIAAAANKHCTQ